MARHKIDLMETYTLCSQMSVAMIQWPNNRKKVSNNLSSTHILNSKILLSAVLGTDTADEEDNYINSSSESVDQYRLELRSL